MAGDVPAAEFRIANRDFKLPESHDLQAACLRVSQRFAVANRRLVRDEDAAKKSKSLETLFNVRVAGKSYVRAFASVVRGTDCVLR